MVKVIFHHTKALHVFFTILKLCVLLKLCMSFFMCILQVYERFNKFGLCLVKTMKYTIQEDIGAHFLDKVVEEVKDGKTFSFVIDNIDWEEHVHEMRSDNQNESVHAVATSIVFHHTKNPCQISISQHCILGANCYVQIFLEKRFFRKLVLFSN